MTPVPKLALNHRSNSMGRRWRLLLVTVAAFAMAVPALADSRLELELLEESVRVTGVTPAGAVALVGFMRYERNGFLISARTHLDRTDSDGDGSVTFDLHHPVTERSIFVAVDHADGTFAVRSGSPERAPEIDPPSDNLGFFSGVPKTLFHRQSRAMAWFVRPGRGTWFSEAVDGSELDHDGSRDRQLLMSVEDFEPVGGPDDGDDRAEAPLSFESRDVLLVLDPIEFSFYVVQLEG